MPPNIDVHIDRIVLHGFEQMNAADLKAAILEHLGTLISEQNLTNEFIDQSHIGRLKGQINLPVDGAAHSVGSEIAQGIYHSMKSST